MNHGANPWECRYRIPGAQFISRARMSYAESPTQTLIKFDKTPEWKNASIEVIKNDFFCISNKTNLEWDPYVYEEKDGKLFDPVRNKFIVGSAGNDEIEEGINKELEDWWQSHDSGIAVWISPRGGRWNYPEEKIAIHRISYKWPGGEKALLCSSLQFKTEFKNPNQIRRFIFTEDDKEESIFEIINWLKKVSAKNVPDSVNPNLKMKWEQAEHYAFQYKSGVSFDQIIYQMTQTEFLGQNPIGCAGISNVSGGFSYLETTTQSFGYEDQYGSLQFSCPKCHNTNTRPFGQLISNCQHCGADVTC